MNLLYLIDTDRDRTVVHRVDLDLGQYLPPRIVKGLFLDQVEAVINHMHEDRPSKIVIDEMSIGKGFADRFQWRVLHPSTDFTVDANGNVRYL